MRPKILVIGDLMVDHYIWGGSSRVSPEAPVLVVNIKEESNRLGGACNVANNLVALGAEVGLCGVVGCDLMGEWIARQLASLGICNLIFEDPSRPTTCKSRVLVSSQQVLRVDKEQKAGISLDLEQRIWQRLQDCIQDYDGIVISDYDKGLLSKNLTSRLIQLAKSQNKKVLCDPKGDDYSKYAHATLLTPNKKEAMQALDMEIADDASLQKALLKMQKDYNLEYALITLSEEGIGILQDQNVRRIPALAREVYDVTGAGDSVIAALSFCLMSNQDIQYACEFANAAAAVVVGKVGSATATLREVQAHLQSPLQEFSFNRKLAGLDEIQEIVKSCKKEGKKIIFTNGCFDLLHRGHAQYLQQARALGDVLIVGLNSDDSIKGLKGPARPINNQEDRAFVLAALGCVDYIIIFDSPTPRELIALLEPDVLVKGADYRGKEVAGSEFAKEVRLLDFVPGRSSSRIIQKIQENKE